MLMYLRSKESRDPVVLPVAESKKGDFRYINIPGRVHVGDFQKPQREKMRAK